jgi:MraZ protein
MSDRPAYLRMWGHYEHSLDDKGRVIVPLALRDALGEEFVLTTGAGNHIRAYPMPIWDVLEEQLLGQDLHDEQDSDKNLLLRLFGNCEFVRPDPQNRVSIPRHMRQWAGLIENETAIIIGLGRRVEIWSRENWNAASAEFNPDNVDRASRNLKLTDRPRPEAMAA